MGKPVVSRPGEGEMHERGDGYRLIRVDLPDIAAIEIDFDETLVVDPHTHPDHTDSWLAGEGEVGAAAGDEKVALGPGGFIPSPPGVRHGFRSAGGRARVLNFLPPRGTFPDEIRGTTPAG